MQILARILACGVGGAFIYKGMHLIFGVGNTGDWIVGGLIMSTIGLLFCLWALSD